MKNKIKNSLKSNIDDGFDILSQKLGNTIRTARHNQKLSLHTLAKKSGVSYLTIHRIENGRGNPNLLTIRLLANALGYDLIVKLQESEK